MKRVITTKGYLYCSQIPKENDLRFLSLEDDKPIDIIWNLAADAVRIVPMEKLFATEVLIGNIEDYSIPSDIIGFDNQLIKVINKLIMGGKVLIHCVAGKGRTGLALACIHLMLEGSTAEQALKFANLTCNGPETDEQKDFVHDLSNQ